MDEEYIGLAFNDKSLQRIIDAINIIKLPMIFTMPCGKRFSLTSISQIIAVEEKARSIDIPCTCGNPNHWFVKFERGER